MTVIAYDFFDVVGSLLKYDGRHSFCCSLSGLVEWKPVVFCISKLINNCISSTNLTISKEIDNDESESLQNYEMVSIILRPFIYL